MNNFDYKERFIMRKIIVSKKFNNKKLNECLYWNFPNLRSSSFFKALRKKDIKVNGCHVKENVIVNTGDVIEIFISDEFLFGEIIDLKVVFEDENILVINKPVGISVTEDDCLNGGISLEAIVRKKYGENIAPCHRLDRNTSGIILFAKNLEAKRILLEKFKNHEIKKYYKYAIRSAKAELKSKNIKF